MHSELELHLPLTQVSIRVETWSRVGRSWHHTPLRSRAVSLLCVFLMSLVEKQTSYLELPGVVKKTGSGAGASGWSG